MPLPIPNQNESQQDFMTRCVLDLNIINEFPEEGQRISVCYRIWKGE